MSQNSQASGEVNIIYQQPLLSQLQAWTGGGHKIVILSSEPTTKYAGWIYLIEEVV